VLILLHPLDFLVDKSRAKVKGEAPKAQDTLD
jgi:hypothetical protein